MFCALNYGKSNNRNPYNLDKNIDGQNYDAQRVGSPKNSTI